MPRPHQFQWTAPDADGICLAQTTAGAGALIINGALLDLPATMQASTRVVLPGVQRTVSITSAADLSGVDFTITGTDLRGATVTETLAGPDTSPTVVYTTAEFHTITNVTVDDAVGTNVTVGTGTTGQTNWMVLDDFISPFNVGLGVTVTGTIDYDVQYTFDNVQATTSPVAFTHPDLDGKTASADGNFAFPCRAVQMLVNSSTDGTAVFTVAQAGA